mgnify:CR=1 FL=1
MTGEIGIGPTEAFSLRVSVATLARVVFPRPADGVTMLALENKATLVSRGRSFEAAVLAQPFGGAVRILDLARFAERSGGFHFDSRRAGEEHDFRIYIQPDRWEELQALCRAELLADEPAVLESSPERELVEEFHDTLGFHLAAEDYTLRQVGMAVERQPAPTTNLHAAGSPTVRIYRIDHVEVCNPALQALMLRSSQAHPAEALRRRAFEGLQSGGRGRANAVLALPLAEVRAFYRSLPEAERGKRLTFGGAVLAGNVAAVLELSLIHI